MNFLLIQENGRHDQNRHFRECFCLQRSINRLGHQADVFGLGHDNFGQPVDFEDYDFIINLENYDTGWMPNLAQVKTKKLMWSIDAHVRGIDYFYELFKRDNYQLILQSTKDFVGPDSVWFPNAYDDGLIGPRDVPIRADIGFCGNVNNRGQLLGFLNSNFKFIADIFVIGEDMVRAINSYKVSFNCNIANDINYRSFETIGCGVALLTNFNQQYVELGFKDGENCMMYSTLDEILDKARKLIEDDDLRAGIARAGFELAAQHTYDKRAELLLEIVGGL